MCFFNLWGSATSECSIKWTLIMRRKMTKIKLLFWRSWFSVDQATIQINHCLWAERNTEIDMYLAKLHSGEINLTCTEGIITYTLFSTTETMSESLFWWSWASFPFTCITSSTATSEFILLLVISIFLCGHIFLEAISSSQCGNRFPSYEWRFQCDLKEVI